MSERLKDRLRNWKFNQALEHLNTANDDQGEVITALAETFGDCGWFDGNLGTIVGAALDSILTDEKK